MSEDAFVIRAQQCLAAIDDFVKEVRKSGARVPQSVVDAVEAFREQLPKGESDAGNS
jgi:hypothetical protein